MSLFDFSPYRRPDWIDRHGLRGASFHEHRAPTDESVRLLKEFEEAARAKIEASFRPKECPLDVVVTVYKDVLDDMYTVAMHYRINGQPRKAAAHVHRIEYTDLDNIAQRMRKALITDLSQYILAQCFEDVVATVVAR